jgi:hypothetical protein
MDIWVFLSIKTRFKSQDPVLKNGLYMFPTSTAMFHRSGCRYQKQELFNIRMNYWGKRKCDESDVV